MTPGRIVRSTRYQLELSFPYTALNSNTQPLSGISWADPADHTTQFPIPFWACGVAPKSPPASSLVIVHDMLGSGGQALLHLCDSDGNHFAHYTLGLQSPQIGVGTSLALPPAWEQNYKGLGSAFDGYENPLAFACGLEYELLPNPGDEIGKALDDPAVFLVLARAGVTQFLEQIPDVTLWAPAAWIIFNGATPAYRDCSAFFGPACQLMLPKWPLRRYSRWRLELLTGNPPAPYTIKQVYAEGPVTGDVLQAADSYEPEWDPATKQLANPTPAGWTEPLQFRIVVW
ncbi:MAG: hypothetical protein ABSE73_23965 [Planctomycetota bacterium]